MNEDIFGLRYQPGPVIASVGGVTTYWARDTWLGHEVVLARAGHNDGSFQEAVAALRQGLSPHLVSLYDAGWDRSSFAAVQAPGGTLADRAHPWGEEQTIELGDALSAALAAWHGDGLVHGDLHPGAIAFDADDRPLLSPWPLAPAPDGWGGPFGWRTSPLDERAGTSVGDLWSLGAVLLSALAGPGPSTLSDAEMAELVRALVARAPDIAEVAARAMAPQAVGGYASAAELRAGLEAARHRLDTRVAVAPEHAGHATAAGAAATTTALVPTGIREVSIWRPRLRPVAVGSVAAAAAMVAGFGAVSVGSGRTAAHGVPGLAVRACARPGVATSHCHEPGHHHAESGPSEPSSASNTPSGQASVAVAVASVHHAVAKPAGASAQASLAKSPPPIPSPAAKRADPGVAEKAGNVPTAPSSATPSSGQGQGQGSGDTEMGPSGSGSGLRGILGGPPTTPTTTTTTTPSSTGTTGSTTTTVSPIDGGHNGSQGH